MRDSVAGDIVNFNNPNMRFMRAADQLSCELDGEIAILNLQSNTYFGVKDVAALIWRELESWRSFDQLVSAVEAQFSVDQDRCRSDIVKMLSDLDQKLLLQTKA